jgi:hypothetical protein
MFEISHADFMDKRSWIMDRRSNIQEFPRFVGLSTNLQPVSIAGVTGHFCRKNYCIWESEYIQGP